MSQQNLPIATAFEGLAIEGEQFARIVPTDDLREALDAWIARRPPSRTMTGQTDVGDLID